MNDKNYGFTIQVAIARLRVEQLLAGLGFGPAAVHYRDVKPEMPNMAGEAKKKDKKKRPLKSKVKNEFSNLRGQPISKLYKLMCLTVRSEKR